MGIRPAVAALLGLLIGAPVGAAAGTFPCGDDQLSVVADLPETAALACGLARNARDLIAGCGLPQVRPVRMVLVQRIEHDSAECLGAYDCASEVIRVIEPAAIPAEVEGLVPYDLLPVEVVFQAVIAHELAHALLDQAAGGREIAFVDQEYVAAVMELETMAPEWREVYIAAAPVSLPPKTGLISAMIYGFEPRKFAVNAWQFFRAEPDGCERIRDIAAGTFTFGDQPR
jgi:hypothetical protein